MTLRTVALLMAAAAASAAQSNAYFFFGPGGVTNRGYTSWTLNTGLGTNIVIAKGVGVNLELGALAPRDRFSDGVGVFSPGGVYYFRRDKEARLQPFVNGGYSLMFKWEGHENLWYAGGGVNYWLTRKIGLRFDFRDHVYPAPCAGCGATQFWDVRAALTLR